MLRSALRCCAARATPAKVANRGRKPAEMEALRERASEMVACGHSIRSTAQELGVQASTVSRWLRQERCGEKREALPPDAREERRRRRVDVEREQRRRLVEEGVPAAISALIAAAQSGEVAAARVILDRAWGTAVSAAEVREWQREEAPSRVPEGITPEEARSRLRSVGG